MDLTRITLYKFHEHFNCIGQELKDPDRFRQILDDARRDLPIIDGLLGLLEDMMRMLKGDEREAATNQLMRDVHMLLALRSIARSENERQESPDVERQVPLAGPLPFRLRRASEN